MDDTLISSKKVNDKYLKYRNQILEYTNTDMNLKLDNEKQVYIALFDIPSKSDIIGYQTHSLALVFGLKTMIVDHRIASKVIQNMDSYNGQNIRLLSCNTGKAENGFAQNLANKLNVEMIAPNNYVWSYPNGKIVIAPRLQNDMPDLKNIGDSVTFKPGIR